MAQWVNRLACVLFVVAGVCPSAAAEGPYPFRLAEGFSIERVAGPPEIQFPMFAALDDQGRLYVAESSGLDLYAQLTKLTRKCRISVLEDSDGDGCYEHVRVFADQLVFPMGLVWRDSRLYVCDPPDVVVYEVQADGTAGARKPILGRFGHTDNGSLHGLDFGPDGRLYGTLGSPDGYRLTRADGSVVTGTTGIVFRCRPDGSRPEVLAHGFTNLIEVAFWPTGEIIGTNTWYQEPAQGLRDSLVHVVEGGFFPYWEEKGQNLPPVTGRKLPALTMFPASACSGMCRVESRQFPRDYHDNLFVAQFNTRSVTRHVLSRDGATFRAANSDFLTTDDPDFRPADVLEDADGSLLVLDTGSWYVQHCPTGGVRKSPAKGAIYRVRYCPGREANRVGRLSEAVPDGFADPSYRQTSPPGQYGPGSKVVDPWGRQIDWPNAPPDRLASLLSDPRPAVRQRASGTLVRRGKDALGPLAVVLRGPAADAGNSTLAAAQRAAVWALAAIEQEASLPPLREALAGSNPEVLALAARAIARRGDRQVAPRLRELLGHAQAHVRMAAAEAMVHCGDSSSIPTLLQALTKDPDPMLQHMLVYALSALADRGALEAALKHEHPRVQQAALILLSQPPHKALSVDQVVASASAADGELRGTAQSILRQHPQWGSQAVDLVRRLIEQPELAAADEAALRSYILAFQTSPAVTELVGRALTQPAKRLPDARQVLLLDTMAGCSLATLPPAWTTALDRAVAQSSPEVRSQAVRTAATLQVPQLDEALARIAADRTAAPPLRLEALRGVIRRRPALTDEQCDLLLRETGKGNSPLVRLAAGQIVSEARLNSAQFRQLVGVLRGDPLLSPTVALSVFERSEVRDTAPELIVYLTESIKHGWILPETQIHGVLSSLPEAQRAQWETRLKAAQQSTGDQVALVSEYEPLAEGGNADRGRALFVGKGTCATCHRVGNEGGTIGPDLTKIGAIRSGRDLVESLVLPSATIAQRYETYVVVTNAGRVLDGVLTRRSAEVIVLSGASGSESRIRTDEIDEMAISKRSLMPETTIKLLTREEVRDLLAYLRSLK
jgi:putative membrane-bound dehydrogenase-like protein